MFLLGLQKKIMSKNTFMMIKPDAVERGLIGDILKDITDGGFKIKALKLTQLSLREAKTFYAIHSEIPFFNDLTSYMSRSPIVAAVLEKDNAVSDFRNLIGDTDPSTAKEGTIRALKAAKKANIKKLILTSSVAAIQYGHDDPDKFLIIMIGLILKEKM